MRRGYRVDLRRGRAGGVEGTGVSCAVRAEQPAAGRLEQSGLSSFRADARNGPLVSVVSWKRFSP